MAKTNRSPIPICFSYRGEAGHLTQFFRGRESRSREEGDAAEAAEVLLRIFGLQGQQGTVQWLQRRTRDQKVSCSSPGRSRGRIVSPGSSKRDA